MAARHLTLAQLDSLLARDSQHVHAREIARVEFPAGAWPLPLHARPHPGHFHVTSNL